MYRQRYPAAGTANTRVELKVLELASGKVTPVELELGDGYLARVDWFPDSKHLAVQRQTRDQKRLDLLKVDAASGQSQRAADGDQPELDRAEQRPALPRARGRRSCGARGAPATSISICTISTASCCVRSPPASGWWSATAPRTAWSASTRSAATCTSWRTRLRRWSASSTSTSLDTRTPRSSAAHLARSGLARREAAAGRARLSRSVFIAGSAADREPAQARRLAAALAGAQRARRNASVSRVPRRSRQGRVRLDRGGGRPAAELSPDSSRRGCSPASAIRSSSTSTAGRTTNTCSKDWMGGARAQGYFRQMLAQHGFVVFTLDNRGSGFRGNAFETALAQRFGKVEIEDQLRGVEFLKTQPFVDPRAHRHHGLELRRLHDADGADDDRRVQSRRRGRTGHGLAALRHALHRALSRHCRASTRAATKRAQCCRTPARCTASCCWCTAWRMTTCCSRTARC